MNRRSFLTAVCGSAALAGCAGLKGVSTQQVAGVVLNDTQIIANGLASVVPALPNIPQNISITLTITAQDAAKTASDLSVNMTQVQAAPLVSKIDSYVQVFVKDLATIPTNKVVQGIMADVQILMPLVLTAVGLVLPVATSKAASPSQIAAARARLAALPKTH